MPQYPLSARITSAPARAAANAAQVAAGPPPITTTSDVSSSVSIQSAATGETDFGGAFGGAVAKLVSAGAPIKAVVNYYGADDKTFTGYYVPENSSITKVTDLVGKKVGVNTLGGQNEATFTTP